MLLNLRKSLPRDAVLLANREINDFIKETTDQRLQAGLKRIKPVSITKQSQENVIDRAVSEILTKTGTSPQGIDKVLNQTVEEKALFLKEFDKEKGVESLDELKKLNAVMEKIAKDNKELREALLTNPLTVPDSTSVSLDDFLPTSISGIEDPFGALGDEVVKEKVKGALNSAAEEVTGIAFSAPGVILKNQASLDMVKSGDFVTADILLNDLIALETVEFRKNKPPGSTAKLPKAKKKAISRFVEKTMAFNANKEAIQARAAELLGA